ncbi:MAG: metalloprotease [Thermoplasmata archaeon]
MSGPSPNYAYSYTVGRPPATIHRTSTSSTEILHLSIAYLVLTFDLVLLFGGLTFYARPFLELVATAAVAALTGFVAHEMAHKVSAQRGGYWAEFRLSPVGLFISVITAAAGFLFAAPGATMIGGMASLRDWGRTSLAGPATNFVFALAFLSAAFAIQGVAAWAPLTQILLFLAYINALFAAFNLVPFGPLDGAKVLRWSAPVWAVSFVTFGALTAALYFFTYVIGLPAL